MRIGIRLHDSAKAPLEERLKTVHNQGFTCAHIALSKLFDDPKYSSISSGEKIRQEFSVLSFP